MHVLGPRRVVCDAALGDLELEHRPPASASCRAARRPRPERPGRPGLPLERLTATGKRAALVGPGPPLAGGLLEDALGDGA